jgi:hypothetical protein
LRSSAGLLCVDLLGSTVRIGLLRFDKRGHQRDARQRTRWNLSFPSSTPRGGQCQRQLIIQSLRQHLGARGLPQPVTWNAGDQRYPAQSTSKGPVTAHLSFLRGAMVESNVTTKGRRTVSIALGFSRPLKRADRLMNFAAVAKSSFPTGLCESVRAHRREGIHRRKSFFKSEPAITILLGVQSKTGSPRLANIASGSRAQFSSKVLNRNLRPTLSSRPTEAVLGQARPSPYNGFAPLGHCCTRGIGPPVLGRRC